MPVYTELDVRQSSQTSFSFSNWLKLYKEKLIIELKCMF